MAAEVTHRMSTEQEICANTVLVHEHDSTCHRHRPRFLRRPRCALQRPASYRLASAQRHAKADTEADPNASVHLDRRVYQGSSTRRTWRRNLHAERRRPTSWNPQRLCPYRIHMAHRTRLPDVFRRPRSIALQRFRLTTWTRTPTRTLRSSAPRTMRGPL